MITPSGAGAAAATLIFVYSEAFLSKTDPSEYSDAAIDALSSHPGAVEGTLALVLPQPSPGAGVRPGAGLRHPAAGQCLRQGAGGGPGDDNGDHGAQGHQPGGLVVGLSVTGLSEWPVNLKWWKCTISPGLSLGPMAGSAMNPAADFMPRLPPLPSSQTQAGLPPRRPSACIHSRLR